METTSKHRFDLEERTQLFARNVRLFIKSAPRLFVHTEDYKQLLRSSGSVAANYIEANEAVSKKDFRHRIKICRKEAKESRFWIRALILDSSEPLKQQQDLAQEARELELIFGAILSKTAS